MKICKTCSKEFKNSAIIDGMWKNLVTRSNCLECVPFGTSPYASFDKEKYKDNSRKKQKTYNKRFVEANGRLPGNVRRAKHKTGFTALTNGCQFCGYNRSQRNLAFHHIDESTKEFNVSTREMQYSFIKIKTELLKCVVVCHLCHGDIHDGLIDANTVTEKHKVFQEALNKLETWPQ